MKGLVVIVLLFGLLQSGNPLRCFECASQITYNHYEYDSCFYGDERYLSSRDCPEPSVCAAYQYQTEVPGALTKWSMSRGCQALRFGATCEDIFSDLRRSGSVLPGMHICTTCSTDLCNRSPRLALGGCLWLLTIVLLF